ncbi:MAG TPA: phosphoglycerate kinase [Thermoplasmata archaeon]|nr:phosphoglycerate kinase [Thermoplasmata archaeon]
MRAKRGVGGAPVRGRRVLVRVDFNVPLDAQGQVADDRRIAEALPTIHHLITAGARTILMSHLGRPDGRKDPKYSLRPVVRRLSALLGRPVPFVEDIVGMPALEHTARLGNGDVLMLENLRFHPGEEANDPAFAAQLARLGELFVEDAFGTVHRAHASTVGVPQRLPAFAGLLVEKEVRELSRLVDRPDRPYAVLVGGAKVDDKLPLLESFLGRADTLLIGGALSFPFLAARGDAPGGVPPAPALVALAAQFLSKAATAGTRVVLPSDLVAAPPGADGPVVYPVGGLPAGAAAEDIGPATRAAFGAALHGARTVFWNGPLGRAEDPRFAAGTREVLATLADGGGFKVAAGGDSARVAHDLGVEGVFQFVSTGGGASLEFVQGVELPGLAVLPDA